MAYRNYKVDFEYLGTDYSGLAVEEGVEIEVTQYKIDGFPSFTIFKNAPVSNPAVCPDGIVSVSKNATPTSGYYVVAYVAP